MAKVLFPIGSLVTGNKKTAAQSIYAKMLGVVIGKQKSRTYRVHYEIEWFDGSTSDYHSQVLLEAVKE
jgi:hypothetical protein